MQQMYSCPTCGAQIVFGTPSCPNCRTPLNWPSQQQIQTTPVYEQQRQPGGYGHEQQRPERKKTSPWLTGFIVLMVTAGLVAGGIFAFDRLSQDTPPTVPPAAAPPANGTSAADATEPVIANVLASSTETSAVVTWTTDEPASSQVEYGASTAYGSTSALEEALVASHSVTLSDLEPESTYHYRVKSEDGSGNQAVSGDYTFTTLTATPTESYQYHDYYPIMLSLSDNKGNIVKSSSYNGYSGPYHSTQTGTSLKIGDQIQWEVEAVGPDSRQIWYNFHSNSGRFNELIGHEGGDYKWTTNNKVTYQISAEDLETAGETMRVVAQVKTEKEYLRKPGGGYDDVMYLDYTLVP